MTEAVGNEIVEQRQANLKALADKGYPPFGRAFRRTGRLAEIRAGFEENKEVALAGRLTTSRDMGKSIFADLRDGSDRFQIYAQKNTLGDGAFEAFKLLDLGDHIGVEGTLFTTRTGELTVKIARWTLLSKALLPLPEKWHGLKDTDQRYRQRYLDLVSNPAGREVFNQRIRIVREIRNYLFNRGFQEVETPMMQPQPGGANARPFTTHYEALDARMYLRIAPELYLKRLLVGGFDRIFELNRNFRNEGLSRTHNPEFTMMEVYEAYSDMRGMKDLVEDLVTNVAQTVMGSLRVGGTEADASGSARAPIDLSRPWREVAYRDLVTERMGADWFARDAASMREAAEQHGLHIPTGWTAADITQEVYSKLIEKTLHNPTFVTRLPAELVPLAKRCEDDASVVDVFELVIGGKEIAPGYSELNDPIEQRRRFEEQSGADAQKVDEDFLTALEHGMPPAGGMGIGIDRLVMTLTGSDAIRDVILFPQLKPREV
jgi:lysyl-tRNA synthetase class 2